MHSRSIPVGAVALLAALAMSPLALAQGDTGFLRGSGHLDVALTYGLDTYDEFWLGDDKIDNDDAGFGRVDRQQGNLYAAYGLTDEIDLVLNASYVYASAETGQPHEQGFQDMSIGCKWRFFSARLGDGTLNVLAAPAVKFPLTHYEDNAVTAIGDGNVDLLARAIIQYTFDMGAFLALDTGYDFRFDSPPDAFPLHFTAGFTVESLTLYGFYSYIDSLSGYDIGEGPFPGVEEDYDRVGAGLYLRLTDSFGITATGYTTLDGKNTGDVVGFSAGFVLRF